MSLDLAVPALAPAIDLGLAVGGLVAVVFALWQVSRLRRQREQLLAVNERFTQLADNVRDIFWLTDWVNERIVYVSPAYETVMGASCQELLDDASSWLRHVHDEDRDWVAEYYREMPTRGTYNVEFRFVRPDGSIGWLHARAFPIRDATGAIVRAAGIAEEVTERREAEERQRLLSLELDHRVKNTLAGVIALAEQTAHSARGVEDFHASFAGRVHALARTHEALAANRWSGVQLSEVTRTIVGPSCGSDDTRLVVDGEDLTLRPRASTSIGLGLHELTTNAAKYGALSCARGRIEVTWSSDATGRLSFLWRERGGPAPSEPRDAGLGTRIVRGVVEHELGGTIQFDFEREGLVCRIEIPDAIKIESEHSGSDPVLRH